MRVFVTGATGFIGSAVVDDLIAAGHEVIGMSRSEEGDRALLAAGARVHRGTLENPASLREGAAKAEGVIHTAFIHDFSKFEENCKIDRAAIEALGSVLIGTGRPLVVTAGIGILAPNQIATEDMDPPSPSPLPRVSEQVALTFAAQGVRVSVVRLPQVHDRDKHGLVSYAMAVAQEKGVSAYVGDGQNRWPAVHRLDAAPLYRLALESGIAGARYHAIAEEGVPLRDIAESIGRGLDLPVVSLAPEKVAEHFGWLGFFIGADAPASSALTRARLGWQPSPERPTMLADLERASVFSR